MPEAQDNTMTSRQRMGKRKGLFIVLFITLVLSLVRGWHDLNHAEWRLQLIFSFPITIGAIATILLPEPAFQRFRTPALIICRLVTVLMPSFKKQIRQLLQAETALGQKWAHNRLGAIAVILFSSRSIMLGVSSVAMPLDFIPTLLVQLLIFVSAWPSDLGLCSAKLAAAPDILMSLNAVHYLFSVLWGICMPFFWTPLPPSQVLHSGASFLAVTLLVQICSGSLPVLQSIFREAASYQQCLVELMSSNTRRNYSTNSSSTTPSGNGENRLLETIYRIRRGNDASYIAPPHPINNDSTTNNNNTTATTPAGPAGAAAGTFFPNYQIPFATSTSNIDFKGPPLAAKLCLLYQNIIFFPAHAAWLVIVTMSLLWMLCYKAAERMCA